MGSKRDRAAVGLTMVLTIALLGGSLLVPPVAAAQIPVPVAADSLVPSHRVAADSGVDVRSGPGNQSQGLTMLEPGAPVRFLGKTAERRGGDAWWLIATRGGLVGWVPAAALDSLTGSDQSASKSFSGDSETSADPIVGTWTGRGRRGLQVNFGADGRLKLLDARGRTWHGSWRPIERSAQMGLYALQAGRGRFAAERPGLIVRVSGGELHLGNAVLDRIPAPPLDAPTASATAESEAGGTAGSNEPFPGVIVESLATGGYPPDRQQAMLSRVTMGPGVEFAYPFPYPGADFGRGWSPDARCARPGGNRHLASRSSFEAVARAAQHGGADDRLAGW